MTCIAWDGKTLAADRRCCYGTTIAETTKIHRVGDVLVGGSGDLSFVLAVIEWVRNGRKPDAYPDSQKHKDDWQPVLVIEADGTSSLYERTPYPIRYENVKVDGPASGTGIAIGSGRDYARAAMYLGLTAKEAVEVACALDSSCGNGVDTLELGSSVVTPREALEAAHHELTCLHGLTAADAVPGETFQIDARKTLDKIEAALNG